MVSNFFGETNLESLLQHQDEIKKKPKGKGSFQEVTVTHGDPGYFHEQKLLTMTS